MSELEKQKPKIYLDNQLNKEKNDTSMTKRSDLKINIEEIEKKVEAVPKQNSIENHKFETLKA